jgi:hypothetical protein
MEAIRSSEMSGAIQRTTWRHIPEDDIHFNLLFFQDIYVKILYKIYLYRQNTGKGIKQI